MFYVFLLLYSVHQLSLDWITDIICLCHADLIFLIYLYQRWVYPVDKKRVNEFGFAAEDVDQAASSSDTPALKEDEKKTN